MNAFDVIAHGRVQLAGVTFLLALSFAQHLYVGLLDDADCVQIVPAAVGWAVN